MKSFIRVLAFFLSDFFFLVLRDDGLLSIALSSFLCLLFFFSLAYRWR